MKSAITGLAADRIRPPLEPLGHTGREKRAEFSLIS